MAAKVPISAENIAFERLNLSRHYLTVDCDFTCFLVLNPSGSVPSEGTDICALHTGAWQIDAWSLLTKKDFPNIAGFSACLVWDKTLVTETAHAPQCVESDIDTANSVSSLKGQPVNITGFTMPDGSALPTSLVLGSGDSAVSLEHPLPVWRAPLMLNVVNGQVVDVLKLRIMSFDFTPGDVEDLYSVYPLRACCDYSGLVSGSHDSGYMSVFDGRCVRLSNGDSKSRAGFMPVPLRFSIHVSKDGDTVVKIVAVGTVNQYEPGVVNISNLGLECSYLRIFEV